MSNISYHKSIIIIVIISIRLLLYNSKVAGIDEYIILFIIVIIFIYSYIIDFYINIYIISFT